MKTKLIIFLLILTCFGTIQLKAQMPITDTLQWLKTKIEQKKAYYIGKPFSFLLDTLRVNSIYIQQYTAPVISYNAPTLTQPKDTIYSNNFTVFFGEYYGGGVKAQMRKANRNINTHIPYISLTFSAPIPFPSSILYDPTLRKFFGPIETRTINYIVTSIVVGEY